MSYGSFSCFAKTIIVRLLFSSTTHYFNFSNATSYSHSKCRSRGRVNYRILSFRRLHSTYCRHHQLSLMWPPCVMIQVYNYIMQVSFTHYQSMHHSIYGRPVSWPLTYKCVTSVHTCTSLLKSVPPKCSPLYHLQVWDKRAYLHRAPPVCSSTVFTSISPTRVYQRACMPAAALIIS